MYQQYGFGGLLNMRFHGLAVMVGVVALSACAGGDKRPGDTTAVAIDTSAPAVSSTPIGSPTPAASGVMAPITGTTHVVNMVGDAKGYRFEPANITVKQGDGIRWVMVSGGPHNVAFDVATTPADVRAQLDANMGTDKMGELSSSMKMNPGETITVSFANIKAGKYPYNCVPHIAMNMKGVVTVQ
jgi:plastocyanin